MKITKPLAFIASALLLASCQSPTSPTRPDSDSGQFAVNVTSDEKGIGGSGVKPDSTPHSPMVAQESGIGGSGRQDSDRGIGGSGMFITHNDERGIGGSGRTQDTQTTEWLSQLKPGEKLGVVGTINAFGSIWVNGLHIQYDENTHVTRDGLQVDISEIKLGQRSIVTATRKPDGTLYAESIELVHEVIGPVSSVDKKTGEITVLNQTVRVPEALANQESLPETGSWVAVSGIRSQDGSILASRLEQLAQGGDILLRGTFEKSNEQAVISGFEVSSTSSATSENLKTGQYAVLRGQLSGNTLSNTHLTAAKGWQDKRVRLVSVERAADMVQRPGPYSNLFIPLPSGTKINNKAAIIQGHIGLQGHPVPDHVQPARDRHWQQKAPAQPTHHQSSHMMNGNTLHPTGHTPPHPTSGHNQPTPQASIRPDTQIYNRPDTGARSHRVSRPPRPEHTGRDIRPQRPHGMSTTRPDPHPGPRPTRPPQGHR